MIFEPAAHRAFWWRLSEARISETTSARLKRGTSGLFP